MMKLIKVHYFSKIKLIQSKKQEKCKKGKKDTNEEWARKGHIRNYFYYQWLKYQKTDIIPLGSYTK